MQIWMLILQISLHFKLDSYVKGAEGILLPFVFMCETVLACICRKYNTIGRTCDIIVGDV